MVSLGPESYMMRENLFVNAKEIEGHGGSCLRDVAETHWSLAGNICLCLKSKL